MVVMKFGGSSMGSAKRMEDVASIIKNKNTSNLVIIVSAVSGVSNFLANSIVETILQSGFNKNKDSEFLEKIINDFKEVHFTIIQDLKRSLPSFDENNVLENINVYFEESKKLFSAILSFGECPESVEARLMGLGEEISVQIIAEVLKVNGLNIQTLDSRDFIITEGSLLEGDPVYEIIEKNFSEFKHKKNHVVLAPGFVSKDIEGKPSLLGRNGSDFSAALFAFGIKASKLEIWTDVDGIYTADPRIVNDAVIVRDLSYEEAMELSFFGSKVLHPKTLIPIASRKIPTYSLNTLNPSAKGSRITSKDELKEKLTDFPVRGVTCLKNTALISITGAGLKGKKGIASRTFQAVTKEGVSVLLITQSSSEYTISFCVKQGEASKVKKALEHEFSLEMREKLINEVDILSDMAIVSIVGDGMRQKKGIAGTFFTSLGYGGINILAIAQGSSERSISTVINEKDGDKAVKIAHRFFFNTAQPINVFLFGTGVVGGMLLDQIKGQQEELFEKGVSIKVCGIADSKSIILSRDGIDLENWKESLVSSKINSSIKEVINFVSNEKPLNPVCVDATASDYLSEHYKDFFNAGMNVVTPNKRANSLSMDYYKSLRLCAGENKRRFLYETNVGAGLPVIGTFQDMLKSGDSLISFSGIMSGSMSYIFGKLDEGVEFSQAVIEAKEKGYTEPDPRDDLSGIDVARKALILAREAGFSLEMEDVKITTIFPSDFSTKGSIDEFLSKLPKIDSFIKEKIEKLKKEGKVLRFVASVDGKSGRAEVGPIEVLATSPLGAIKNGENAFVFNTRYYSPIPLVIRGYGAGADVTASGVFADILRTLKW